MLGGICVGLLSGAPFGAHALLLTIIGFGAGLGQRSPFSSRLLVPLFIIVVATLVYNAGLAIILRLSGWPLAINPTVLRVVAPALLANAVLMPFVYWLVARVFELRGGLRPEF
jgi:rod shape-determining protein MreD